MSTYIFKRNGGKTSTRYNNLPLDLTAICGLESLHDPVHLRTIRNPGKDCICVFNYVSRIVSVVWDGKYNTALCISDVREETK